MQRRFTFIIFSVWVCPTLEQQFDNLNVTFPNILFLFLCCYMQRRFTFLISSVWVCPTLEQQFDNLKMAS